MTTINELTSAASIDESNNLVISPNKDFGYNVYGNYNLVKFSKMMGFTDFTLHNRGVDEDHVNEIYETIKKNKNLSMPPIELISYLTKVNGDIIYIGNGQHRFLAYKKLYENDNIDMDVMCIFHDANNEEELEKIIKIINGSKPVTTMFGYKERNEFIERIGKEYDNIYSNSQNHHQDKMHKIKLRDQLDKHITFDGENNANYVFEKLEKFNQIAKKEFEGSKSRQDVELYNRIKHYSKFYCLMYRDYTWVTKFKSYLKHFKATSNQKQENFKNVTIEYNLGNKSSIKQVMISGDWDDWTSKESMIYDKTKNTFKITKSLHKGVYEYKFVINDNYELHPEMDKHINRNGYENHRIIL
jgi:hypothetical protein